MSNTKILLLFNAKLASCHAFAYNATTFISSKPSPHILPFIASFSGRSHGLNVVSFRAALHGTALERFLLFKGRWRSHGKRRENIEGLYRALATCCFRRLSSGSRPQDSGHHHTIEFVFSKQISHSFFFRRFVFIFTTSPAVGTTYLVVFLSSDTEHKSESTSFS